MKVPCIKCKGNNPANCGRTFCPIVARRDAMFKVKPKLDSEHFVGSSPSPFVGRFGYPFVNVGILSPAEQKEDTWLHDAPRFWAEKNFEIPQIMGLRSELINSQFKAMVGDARKQQKLLSISQEIGMASKPVDVDISLKQKPQFRINYQAEAAPTGPNAQLENASMTSNPKIHTKVEKIVSDAGLKANAAVVELWKHGFDENFLTRILSVGNLGMKKDRKLVPTRFSITAIDDMIGKHLMEKVKKYNQMNYSAYFGSYLGNYYLFLVFPEVWSYELFEMHMPHAEWNVSRELQYTTDYEGYAGRKNYAENCSGGYYSVRLAVLEKLDSIKRQGSVLALRVITGEYAVPLGVWVTREATRKAMTSKPIEFSSKELMLKYTESLMKKKFGIDVAHVLNKSILLKNIGEQRTLAGFV